MLKCICVIGLSEISTDDVIYCSNHMFILNLLPHFHVVRLKLQSTTQRPQFESAFQHLWWPEQVFKSKIWCFPNPDQRFLFILVIGLDSLNATFLSFREGFTPMSQIMTPNLIRNHFYKVPENQAPFISQQSKSIMWDCVINKDNKI